jgi:RND family efflux transporter MFP subunit
MNRKAKIGVWAAVIAAVVVAFIVTGAKRVRKQEVKSIESVQLAEGVPVDVVQARAIPLESWREFVGVAEGYEQIDLVAPFRTRVSAVHVSVGSEVKPGTVLVSLDPYDPAWAGMNLETARTAYETARQDSTRVAELFKAGAVSQQDMDHVRASTEAARAQYTTSRRAVELDTPIAGVVTSLTVKAGDYAAADQTLATVASYGRIRVPLEMSEADRALVAVGQPVRVRYGGAVGDGVNPGGRTLQGEVVKVALSTDPTTRLFDVEVLIDNPDRMLKPGTLATPEILVARSETSPVIPPDAVVSSNGADYVYVVDDSSGTPLARKRPITAGIANGTLAAIAEGLVPGDVVVVWGQNNLEDGAKVKVHKDLTVQTYGSER